MFGRSSQRNRDTRRKATPATSHREPREPTPEQLEAAVIPPAADARFLLLKPSPEDKRDLKFETPKTKAFITSLPSSVDMTPLIGKVLDQGPIGSCAANAGAVALRYLYKTQLQQDWLPSRLALYYVCRVYMSGDAPDEDTGCYLRDLCKAIARYQLPPEMYVRYDPAKFSQPPPFLQQGEMAPVPLIEYRAVNRDEYSLKTALSQKTPVVIGIALYESFVSATVATTGVVPMPNLNTERCLGGHAVLLVGYSVNALGSTTWILRNSWSNTWGKAGNFTLPSAYLTNPNLCFDAWLFSKAIEA